MPEDTGTIGFSYKEFEDLVRRFAESVPLLLLRHPETAELTFKIEQLRLAEALESRFTVAIIGQMRVGKSTLLNALIGRKLAPTGVTETTATINWFRHGTGDICDKFRVHWIDGSMDDLPLAQVEHWIGDKANATKTRALDFFADSEFLRTANIVDTPGTRSVLDSHTEATQGFLAEKLEAETLKHGGRADAVIYAINPVAREDDQELLQLFGERTRLPGASAYNSIAVVQKWEHLEPDPLLEVEKKCDRLRQQLQGKVAEVIPASGLLANSVYQAPLQTWADIARLATESAPDTVRYLLRTQSYFGADRPGSALDVSTRAALCQAMEWPALRFIVRLAQARSIHDGPALRQAVLEASGIEKLKAVLQTRFFSLAGLIQASTVLRKAWDPCTVALLKLRELARLRQDDRALGRQSLEILSSLSSQNTALEPVARYVQRSLAAVENDLQQVLDLRRELDRIKDQAESNFQLLDSDITCLKCLERLPAEALSKEERAELYRLFGGHGPEVWTRIGLPATTAPAEATDRLWDRHEHWARRKSRTSGDLLKVCEHALSRLGTILDYLEEQEHENFGART